MIVQIAGRVSPIFEKHCIIFQPFRLVSCQIALPLLCSHVGDKPLTCFEVILHRRAFELLISVGKFGLSKRLPQAVQDILCVYLGAIGDDLEII